MLNPFRHYDVIEEISCPYCLSRQKVHRSTLSKYCPNCRRRLDLAILRNKNSGKKQARDIRPKTRPISCPFCHSVQEILDTAISTYCKNCRQRIQVKETPRSDFSQNAHTLSLREIICPHCNERTKVPPSAISSSCTECGGRINLQNYEIRGVFRGSLNTKGSIHIASSGMVEGNINTGSLIVSGRFSGEVTAEERVELQSTARLKAKIRAPALIAKSGAVFKGSLHIGRKTESETTVPAETLL